MKKTVIILSLLIAVMLALNGCALSKSSGYESTCAKTGTAESSTKVNSSDMFTSNDMEVGYNEETAAKITLEGNGATSASNAVNIAGSMVTVTDEGTYIISGKLNNGMIIVDADDTDKVHLVLNGVQIKSLTSAAVYVKSADKVFVTVASDTENTLENGGEYTAIDDNNIDAVIFSKSDLTFNGSGKLTVNAAAGHGVVSKDDLVLVGGIYDITAASHGLFGKDSIRIANGTYNITAGKDGLQAENTDDAEKGFIYISGGSFKIKSDGDGISSDSYIQIENGNFTINTGDGSAGVAMTSDAMDFGMKGGFKAETTTGEADNSVSRKGIKTDGELTINSGEFTIDAEDDAFHAGGNILICGGSFEIKTGDDGVHSDTDVTIKNGDFNVSYCYEGIEGQTVTIDKGTLNITSFDDGINSAGGADSSGFGGGRPEQDRFTSSSDSLITVNDGTIIIVSDGDCLDSNGAIIINGGRLNLTCNGNGNTALDCDGTYTNNGGDVTTNDGSENNSGHMGGGHDGIGGRGSGMGNMR